MIFLLTLLCNIIQFDSPLVFPIEYFQVRGLINTTVIKPYELNEVISGLDTLLLIEEKTNKIDRHYLSMFAPFFRKSPKFHTNFNLGIASKNFEDFYGNFDYQITGQISEQISFGQGIRFKVSSTIEDVQPQPWKDVVQAYLFEGYCKIANKNTSLVLGRRNLLFGYDEEHSLLLSPDKEGYDGYLFAYRGRYYEFQSSFSVINTESMRFLSIHRLGLDINYVKLGFSEAILWGGKLEPIYLNFLVPYYLSQWGLYRNDNIMWQFDGMIKVFSSIIYGHFLIDDYQFSEPPPGYTEYPHKLALQVGYKKIFGNFLYIGARYSFVDKWVYTHYLPVNVYQKDSIPIGYPLGNDVDNLTLSMRLLKSTKFVPGFTLNYVRKGEGSIFLPYEIERGPAYPDFPSGIVEKTLKISGHLDLQMNIHTHLGIETGKVYQWNKGHSPGVDNQKFFLDLKIWLIF